MVHKTTFIGENEITWDLGHIFGGRDNSGKGHYSEVLLTPTQTKSKVFKWP